MPRIISFLILLCLFSTAIAFADGAGPWEDYDQGYATALLDVVQVEQSVCVVMGIADAGLEGSDSVGEDNSDCSWSDELTWLTYECIQIYDENGNSMSQSEVLEECNECYGTCAAGYFGNCNDAVLCMRDVCSFEAKKQTRPFWYDANMGTEESLFSLYRWNQTESKELFTKRRIGGTGATNMAEILDERFIVGAVWVYPDLCAPAGKSVYSFKNIASGGTDSAAITVQNRAGECMDTAEVCNTLDVSGYTKSEGKEKKGFGTSYAFGCDISEQNTGFSLAVIMTLVGLFAFGLSLRE